MNCFYEFGLSIVFMYFAYIITTFNHPNVHIVWFGFAAFCITLIIEVVKYCIKN